MRCPTLSVLIISLGQADTGAMASAFVIRTALFAGLSMGRIIIDPTDEDAVFALNSEYVARTPDGGKTWDDATALNPDPAQPDLWRGRGYAGWCCTRFRFSPTDPRDSVFTALDAGKLWRSRDGLGSWRYHGSEPWAWGGGQDLCYAGPCVYAVAGQFGDNLGLLRIGRADGKTTLLTGAAHGLPELHQGGQPTGIYAQPDAPQQVWAAIGGALYRSTDAGEHWSLIQKGLGFGHIAGETTKPARFYVDGKDGIWRTEDGLTF